MKKITVFIIAFLILLGGCKYSDNTNSVPADVTYEKMGTLSLAGTPQKLFYNSQLNRVYVYNEENAVYVVDCSSVLYPSVATQFSVTQAAYSNIFDMTTDNDNYLYFALGSNGVSIYDLYGSPAQAGSIFPANIKEVELMNTGYKTLYLTNANRIESYNVEQPSYPTLKSFYEDINLNLSFSTLTVTQGLVFAAANTRMYVFDSSNPNIISKIKHLDYLSTIRNIIFQNNYFVVMTDYEANIYSTSDITQDQELSRIYFNQAPDAVQLIGNHLLIAIDNTISLYDISNPDIPVLLDNTSFTQSIKDAKWSGNYLYLITDEGLAILKLTINS